MKYSAIVYSFLAATLLVACGKNNPDKKDDKKPSDLPAVILSQDFTKGLGGFTVEDKDKGGFSGAIWKFESGSNAKYGAQASASNNGGTNYKAESWLVSPEIDLTYYDDANLYFNHAFAYVNSGEPNAYFGVKISSDGGQSWVSREIPKWLVAHSYFELAQSGNISLTAFKGQKIRIAFVYKSTSETAPTWEILDMTVSTERLEVIPDDQGDQYTAVPAWMELPQVTNAGNFFVHTTILRFDRVRDYSFSYNEPMLVSDWVAYPLYDQFTKKRTDRENSSWVSDPFLVAQKRSCSNVASGGSYEFSKKDYDRGHQIPSADRAGGAMTNGHTFYTSNVTPQLHSFNSGIWEHLEAAVRTWSASSDTLYVVTGCVADATCSTVKDHDGNAVAVPKAYYKALLRLKGGSYIGAGFYLDHKEYANPDGYVDCAMSLKDLEAKTGLTFFVNLPADKATAIKAEDPKKNSFWNL